MTAAQRELVCVVRRTDGRTEWLTDGRTFLSFFHSFSLAVVSRVRACGGWRCGRVRVSCRSGADRGQDATLFIKRSELRSEHGAVWKHVSKLRAAREGTCLRLSCLERQSLSRATTERSGTHHLCPQSHRAAASTDGGDDAAAPFAGRASTLAAQAEPGVRRQCVRLLKHPPTQALSPHCAQSPIDSLALMWQATSRGAATLGHLER